MISYNLSRAPRIYKESISSCWNFLLFIVLSWKSIFIIPLQKRVSPTELYLFITIKVWSITIIIFLTKIIPIAFGILLKKDTIKKCPRTHVVLYIKHLVNKNLIILFKIVYLMMFLFHTKQRLNTMLGKSLSLRITVVCNDMINSK